MKATLRDDEFRERLLYLLSRGGAHLDFESAIAEMPAAHPVAWPLSMGLGMTVYWVGRYCGA